MESQSPVLRRRLSGVDAAFIYVESENIPLNVAAVCTCEAPIPFDAFVRHVDSRLHLLPRYRQVVVDPPFHLGYPTWEDAPEFDIRRHIFQTRLKAPGGEAQLEELAGQILGQRLDRSRPLWDVHVVDGLKNGQGALIVRVHHSLADGVSGIALANILFDTTPEGSPAPPKPRVPRPRKAPAPSLLEAAASGLYSSLHHLIDAQAGLLEIAKTWLSNPGGLAAAAGLLPEIAAAVERLPFNKIGTGERKFCWTEVDLAEVQAIRAVAGGSVNDVILALVTRALSRYVEQHGQTVDKRLVRLVCPVNLRRDHGETLGNQITFRPIVLPLDIKDPVGLLQAVAARTMAMKKVRAADLLTLTARCIAIAPPPIQFLLWRGISNVMLPVPLFNMICTNVPGPPAPFYCIGKRLLAVYPQVPTGYELGINIAVMSYCGKLFFGLIADANIAADVKLMRDFLRHSFEELRRATGVGKAARRQRTRRSAPPQQTPAPAAMSTTAGV